MGGGYTHQTKGTGMALAAAINKMKVELDALRRWIANLGIQVDTVAKQLIIAAGRSLVVNGSQSVGGSLTVSGSETVSGTLDVTGPATFGGNTTIGGSLNVTGPATIGSSLSVTGTETVGGTLDVTGNMIVGGTLSLPDGIIDNTALADPISFAVINSSFETGLNFTTSYGTYATGQVTVPSGFSKALVMAIGTARCTASGSAIYSRAVINGSIGPEMVGFENTATSVLPVPYSLFLSGLSAGSQVTVSTQVKIDPDMTAGTGAASVSATVAFLR